MVEKKDLYPNLIYYVIKSWIIRMVLCLEVIKKQEYPTLYLPFQSNQ
jgi:hypothetical protein